MKYFNIILATDLDGSIGLNGTGVSPTLPWSIKKDMDFFKQKVNTNSIIPEFKNILIMGYKTWLSIKNTNLNKHICIVITKNNIDNVITVHDFNSAFIKSQTYINSDIWIIGGAMVYNAAIRHFGCKYIYHTLINEQFESDVKFDVNNFKMKLITNFKSNDIDTISGKNVELTFNLYKNKNNIDAKYLKLLYNLKEKGTKRLTRNGYTYSLFSKSITIDLNDGFPLLTTKKMFWKGIVEELLFFIRGDTNSKLLEEKGINIWKGNTSKEFLEKTKLDYEEGSMGPMYGYQWRYFNGSYPKKEGGTDQLVKVIDEIKTDPTSRRILMTTFNPSQVHLGVLYPCHSIVIQFYVRNEFLDCVMFQRSCDGIIGMPFNIASTSLLVHIIATICKYKPGRVTFDLGDYHIYDEHIEAVKEQLKRVPYNLPKLVIHNIKTLEDVEKSSLYNYEIVNYQSHSVIKAPMMP